MKRCLFPLAASEIAPKGAAIEAKLEGSTHGITSIKYRFAKCRAKRSTCFSAAVLVAYRVNPRVTNETCPARNGGSQAIRNCVFFIARQCKLSCLACLVGKTPHFLSVLSPFTRSSPGGLLEALPGVCRMKGGGIVLSYLTDRNPRKDRKPCSLPVPLPAQPLRPCGRQRSRLPSNPRGGLTGSRP